MPNKLNTLTITEVKSGLKAKDFSSVEVTTAEGFSQMGSGSLPTQNLVTTLVAITPKGTTAVSLAQRLRMGDPSVFARVKDDRVLIDPRTLRDGDDALIVKALMAILGSSE